MPAYLNHETNPCFLAIVFCDSFQNCEAHTTDGFCYLEKMTAFLTEHLHFIGSNFYKCCYARVLRIRHTKAIVLPLPAFVHSYLYFLQLLGKLLRYFPLPLPSLIPDQHRMALVHMVPDQAAMEKKFNIIRIDITKRNKTLFSLQ